MQKYFVSLFMMFYFQELSLDHVIAALVMSDTRLCLEEETPRQLFLNELCHIYRERNYLCKEEEQPFQMKIFWMNLGKTRTEEH